MIWLWIGNLTALVVLLWGARRLLRNRLRRNSGRSERHLVAARVAVVAALSWVPFYFVVLDQVVRPMQVQRRLQVIDEICAVGGRFSSPSSVDLSGTRATDYHVRLLLQLPELEDVNLAGTAVTDAAVDTLVLMPRLDYVNVNGSAMSGPAQVRMKKYVESVRAYKQERMAEEEAKRKALEEDWKREQEERKLGVVKTDADRYEEAAAAVRKAKEGQ